MWRFAVLTQQVLPASRCAMWLVAGWQGQMLAFWARVGLRHSCGVSPEAHAGLIPAQWQAWGSACLCRASTHLVSVRPCIAYRAGLAVHAAAVRMRPAGGAARRCCACRVLWLTVA